MLFISFIRKLFNKLIRSFINLFYIIFIDIPSKLLRLIFPPSKRKIEPVDHKLISKIAIPNQEEYFNFLIETLQKVSDNPNPQVIYPFLEQNIDKLDDNLGKIFYIWATNTLSMVQGEESLSIARVIGNFSNLIEQFPIGNIAINKDIAIMGYEIVLNVCTYEAFPEEWSMTQHNLAVAYRNRIRGKKADNLEKAIAACKDALKVRTYEEFPYEWAMTEHNLASAYSERIRGEKADNLEKAIFAGTEALKVYTYEAFPQQWANTQHNLANDYSNRIRGEKADNIEQAIASYTEALKVFTYEAFPQYWAGTQQSLASAYSNRIRGEKADNLEKAIWIISNKRSPLPQKR